MIKFNVTLEDIQKLNPCNPAESYLGANWSGTLLDILDHKTIRAEDKIWAVTKLLDDKTARLFAASCAQNSLKYMKDEQLKTVLQTTIDVVVRFANGEATSSELSAAEYAAKSAAGYAAGYAELSAARSAAWSAAWSAELSAAWSAAWFAAEYAAEYAAESAAWFAAEPAAEYAARSAAYAARSAQVEKLKQMILEQI